MSIKTDLHQIKGMQKDLSVSKASSEFAFDALNIRLTARDGNTLLSITNEKGNKKIDIKYQNTVITLSGTVLGYSVLNNYITIFTTSASIDRIYRLEHQSTRFVTTLLYEGNLGFDSKFPIECISIYETEDIQKVYWTDNKNQPRLINIVASEDVRRKWSDTSFDFVTTLQLNEDITITKLTNVNSSFSSGVIQYAFSYYNKYGQSSSIIYTSTLYYVSYSDRGASVEDKVANAFNIVVDNVDNNFDFIRIYSIHRSSLEATPYTKRVVDLPINSPQVSFIDTNNTGEEMDPTELLYIGGEEILAGTITSKDNTLFLGNIQLNRRDIPSTIKETFRDSSSYNNNNLIVFKSKEYKIESPEPSGLYPYTNTLNNNAEAIKTFKYLEWYRFGIQFQHKSGKWTDPIFITDARNENRIIGSLIEKDKTKPIALTKATSKYIDSSCIESLYDLGYIKARPVIVYPTNNDRECICQGVLCPTVYNVEDRLGNSPFIQSSWFTRPNSPFDIGRSARIQYELHLGEFKKPIHTFTPAEYYIIHGYKYKYIKYTTLTLDGEPWIGGVVVEYIEPGIVRYPLGNTATAVGEGENLTFSLITTLEESDLYDRDGGISPSLNSRGGVISNNAFNVIIDEGTSYERTEVFDPINYGAYAEFRHNYPIPDNANRNAEIQSIAYTRDPYVGSDSLETFKSDGRHLFYIDQSILTLHSPDIEFDESIQQYNFNTAKLRIVGIVPITGFHGDIDIQTSTPPNTFKGTTMTALGFYKEPIKASNVSRFGWRGIISGSFWFDEYSDFKDNVKDNENKLSAGFMVYPWHRNGSLNNGTTVDGKKPSAFLERKKLSNIRTSYNTRYFRPNELWEALSKDSLDNVHKGISGVAIFNSNELSMVKLPKPKNSKLEDIIYYGNIDKILTPARSSFEWAQTRSYPIVTTGYEDASESSHKLFISDPKAENLSSYSNTIVGTEPVSMKYKSTPHAVLALNYTREGSQLILPTIVDEHVEYASPSTSYEWSVNLISVTDKKPFWSDSVVGVTQDSIKLAYDEETGSYYNSRAECGIDYGFLWLGELYNDNVLNRFGGTTEDALQNNTWVPCGKSVSLVEYNEGIANPVSEFTLEWTEGDTYYQRYDHLKTYPFTLEDQNSVVDIISFMCETRVNLDGRYDKNRGLSSNLTITPNNFNKLNKVYSQIDNFFNYRILDNKYKINHFPNTITWTKEKFIGEDIDTWTNITVASTLDLDGDKGSIVSLNTFNNEIYCFQKQGISNILFNSRVQIPTSDNVPIPITNGYKVQGKRYISSIGCDNKWTIVESPVGLYFIDNNTKGFYLLNTQVTNISNSLGFDSWFNNFDYGQSWNPEEFNGFVTHYDRNNGDIYITNSDNCLVYSEKIGQFTSFMSYENTPFMFNINDKFYAIKDNFIWEQFAGDYNSFYGETKPYSITVISNPDPFYDKVFNTVEFRSDTWDNNRLLNTTFDTLEVWNEYQYGKSNLANIAGAPSNLKRKFRVWRANVPRDYSNMRDRIRNTWAYVKLEHSNPFNYKTEFHDLIVHYFL